MTREERSTFCGGRNDYSVNETISAVSLFFFTASFDDMPHASATDEQSQLQQDLSAMLSIWNLIADLVESNNQKENEQQQIVDFYGKAGTTFPRLVCLMQLYFNAAKILERVAEYVVFAEGDNSDLMINEKFVTEAENMIKQDFYVYDKTYLPANDNDQRALDPMVIVEKSTVTAAWKWYEYHLQIANTLFRIDHDFTSKSTACASMPSRRKALKELIMLLDFNIFPTSTVTDKHPTTGQTYVYHNSL
jgi:hypothetical protein